MHDFHTHYIPNDVMSWIRDNKSTIHAKWIQKPGKENVFLEINGKWGFELKKSFVNFSAYDNDRKNANVNYSVISPIPQLFMYDFDSAITAEISQVYNGALAEICKTTSENYAALGTVPLNAPDQAAIILQEAISMGLKGAIIGPSVAKRMLSDDYFKPFFEEANRLEAIIFIHPLLSEDPRLKKRMMPNLIGVPWETTVCATDLLLSGFTDQYPNIKVLFAHGGGFLPYQLGRLDKGFEQWEAVSAKLQARPSEYAKRFWYDTVLWSETSIEFLIQTVGATQVVPGSDFPFDLSAWPPISNNKEAIESLLK